MGSVQTFKPTPSLIKIPLGYPNDPTPGKIELLWTANAHSLLHRLSPYTDYDATLLNKLFGDKEPFYYIYADENNKGINALKKYESRVFPIGSGPIDVIRVSKFLASGRGVGFLTKQFLLQTGNAFNETRIYNPTSPIVAAGNGVALGTIRPMRSFDTSAGLAGIANSVLGDVGTAIFGAPAINPPPGTVSTALPDATSTIGGKGLIRAGTANRAFSHLQASWPQNTKGASLTSTFGAVVKGMITSLFSNFIPQNQNGVRTRSDEGTYGLMIGGGNNKFSSDGGRIPFLQRWVGGSTFAMRKNREYPSGAGRLFQDENGKIILFQNSSFSATIPNSTISVGITMPDPSNPVKYGDVYGTPQNKDSGQGSDIMIQHSYFTQNRQFPTKITKREEVEFINASLKRSLENIRSANYRNVYTIDVPDEASAIRSGNSSKNGYDRLAATTTGQAGMSPKNYPLGVLQDYRSERVVDNSLTNNPILNSRKLPTAGHFDAINTLTVLSGNKKINNSKLKGWTTWEPYLDDQIAFFFYDIVNDKYIPFRATIKGLTESGNASWEEMPFIGRGDKVYSYGGFNRNLSLNFHISIGSIIELAPTFQRVNYLTTLIKPSNYTTDQFNGVTNRFMIAPMVLLTVGDLYKDQPILIQSVVTTIPDDASWETNNEFNSAEWSYLASYIKSPQVLYGQLPRSIDLSLSAILLEKERAVVGGANFGHAPRRTDNNENWAEWNTDIPNGADPDKFHQSLVVNVIQTNNTTTKTPQTQTQTSPPTPVSVDAQQPPKYQLLSAPASVQPTSTLLPNASTTLSKQKTNIVQQVIGPAN
jgi:hypothetical protein